MPEPISSAAFRESLAQFASGVTVITATTSAGLVGFTATAFTSVSLEPPLVLVCIAKTASAHDAVVAADEVGVSVLAESQAWIAEQFAQRGIDRFGGVPLRETGGSEPPLVDGALVQLVGRPHTRSIVGDHTLLVLEITHAAIAPGKPLLHFSRKFGGFAAESLPRESTPPRSVAREPNAGGGV
ncbi:MAG TPA: flavin reductase family protein [Labilithrix sp.]|jgi:flavin reductase ActVB|nr:flavin reductase family protein [Labilithrix sp.]